MTSMEMPGGVQMRRAKLARIEKGNRAISLGSRGAVAPDGGANLSGPGESGNPYRGR